MSAPYICISKYLHTNIISSLTSTIVFYCAAPIGGRPDTGQAADLPIQLVVPTHQSGSQDITRFTSETNCVYDAKML